MPFLLIGVDDEDCFGVNDVDCFVVEVAADVLLPNHDRCGPTKTGKRAAWF